MVRTQRRIAVTLMLLLVAGPLAAQDRFGVLEFFGRLGCPSCEEAGAAIRPLQTELAGRAVLLEYDYDTFSQSKRIARFWAAQDSAVLPLVMVGSGNWTTSGARTTTIYRNMVEHELARPAAAAVSAYSRQVGDALRVYVRAQYTGDEDLTAADDPTLWLIVWENRSIGITRTWVRAAGSKALPPGFARGAVVGMVLDTPPSVGLDWGTVQSLALVERGVGETEVSGLRRYDALQAAVARPATLTAAPDRLALGAARPQGSVALDGPHVLTWVATTDVEWLRVDPASGTVPGSPTVSLVDELRPSVPATGTVHIEASGDGMTFATTVTVGVSTTTPRRAGNRLRPTVD